MIVMRIAAGSTFFHNFYYIVMWSKRIWIHESFGTLHVASKLNLQRSKRQNWKLWSFESKYYKKIDWLQSCFPSFVCTLILYILHMLARFLRMILKCFVDRLQSDQPISKFKHAISIWLRKIITAIRSSFAHTNEMKTQRRKNVFNKIANKPFVYSITGRSG